MGVPNATHLWQVPDTYNNGLFKTFWVAMKRWWLDTKRKDLHGRVPLSEKETISKSDVVIIFDKIFARAFGQTEKNVRAIAKAGVFPYTRKLLEHPEIVRNSEKAKVDQRAATDAAIAAAGDAINPAGLQRLERARRAQEIIAEQRRTRLGLDLPDYNGDEAAAWSESDRAAIESVRHTAGGFFRSGEIEFTADSILGRAEAHAAAAAEAAASAASAADVAAAAMRAEILVAAAGMPASGRVRGRGRGGRGGRGARGGAVAAPGGKGGRASWKSRAMALAARVAQLEAEAAARARTQEDSESPPA
jgi:hypothetical protein